MYFLGPVLSCEEGEVIPLVHNSSESDSSITFSPLVCVNGFPGKICNKGFDNQDASVLCRELIQKSNFSFGEFGL